MSFVTFTTDFGVRDGNVGAMKGVIWGIAPDARIADLSHGIAPQNIREAAFLLERVTSYFPPGTVHLVVVDPGVGTDRRPLAARIGPHFYVAPDNGVLTLVLERAETNQEPVKFVHTNKPECWLPTVSNVFHGRDIFSPVAAHLAAGVPLEELGTEIDDPARIALPRPAKSAAGDLAGEVLHVDHFGNLYTNFRRGNLEGRTDPTVRLLGSEIRGLVRTFGERPIGELIALYSSTNYLLISVVNGSAAERLNARVGDRVQVSS
jgi:hypothetical protein